MTIPKLLQRFLCCIVGHRLERVVVGETKELFICLRCEGHIYKLREG